VRCGWFVGTPLEEGLLAIDRLADTSWSRQKRGDVVTGGSRVANRPPFSLVGQAPYRTGIYARTVHRFDLATAPRNRE
jgi:hypothetical protein